MVQLTENMVLTKGRADSLETVRNLNLWGNDLTDVCKFSSFSLISFLLSSFLPFFSPFFGAPCSLKPVRNFIYGQWNIINNQLFTLFLLILSLQFFSPWFTVECRIWLYYCVNFNFPLPISSTFSFHNSFPLVHWSLRGIYETMMNKCAFLSTLFSPLDSEES